MNPVYLFAIPFVLVPSGLFYLFSVIIIYHLRKYSLDKKYAQRLILTFSMGMIAISCLMMVRFTQINWKRVDIERFIEDSVFNNFYQNYDPR